MHHYAFCHKYGINMRDEHGRRIGYVVVFPSANARDEYVYNTEDCAEKITSKVARWHMIDNILAYGYEQWYTRGELDAEDMGTIVKTYLNIREV